VSFHDACFWFLERLEQDGEMTVKNVREFRRDINHYSKGTPGARSRALKYAAQNFLAIVEDSTISEEDRVTNISWASGWLRALVELVADEWFHVFEDVHPNMRPPLTVRQRQWDEYREAVPISAGPAKLK
jgi:hypothetical protein